MTKSKERIKKMAEGNRGVDARSGALVHALWILLTSLLVIGVCVSLNISLFWPFTWFIVGILMIYICITSSMVNVKRILLVDFILSACIVSFILLGQQSEFSLVCYNNEGAMRGNAVTANGFTAHLKVLLHNINGFLDYATGLSFNMEESCLWLKPGNAVKAPWHIYLVELGIITGQGIYALYLAETANRQILEKERLKILT